MNNIDIQYPAPFILLCAALGLAVAVILYFRNARLNEKAPLAVWGLAFLRFLAVTLLALLLLSPVLKEKSQELERPIVVAAMDQSGSVLMEMDSNRLRSFESAWEQSLSDLADKYDVISLSFGEEVRPFAGFEYGDQSSNLSAVLEHVGDLYGDQNLGAILLASDGIYNEGKDPRYAEYSITAPVFTLALGDTTPDRDLTIRQVYSNNIAYLGDRTAIQVDVAGYNMDARNVTVSVSKIGNEGSTLVERKSGRIQGLDFFRTWEFDLPQEAVGLQQYRVTISNLEGERTYRNNRKDFYVDVIDARQKILVLYDFVHPDVAAIKSSLEQNKNYQVITSRFKDLKDPIEEFDVVILHQLPGNRTNVAPFLKRLDALEMPRIFVVGAGSNARLFNAAQEVVAYTPKSRATNEVQAVVNGAFAPFTLPEDLELKLGQFAPLNAPFADYATNPAAEVLLYQKIGKVATEYPLLAFRDQANIKTAVLCADGIWKWRLYDFLQHDNHQLFDALMSKTLQYITVKEDKRKFRVYQNDNLLTSNEEVYLEAELYNQSYELINDPDVTIKVYNASGEAFDYVFSRRNRGYSLNAGRFSTGNYRWVAECTYEGERYEAEGRFSVQEIQKEEFNTVADHNLLMGVASAGNGRMLAPENLPTLTQELIDGDALKPIYYEVVKTRSAIHLKWVFFSLALLLFIEWLGRRLLGTY
ncbi:MAG: hypothetical protein KTR24_08715 [Saprospiraceae bacterium]|nr:hypothetical protein [Saprospiraceae bacterium]